MAGYSYRFLFLPEVEEHTKEACGKQGYSMAQTPSRRKDESVRDARKNQGLLKRVLSRSNGDAGQPFGAAVETEKTAREYCTVLYVCMYVCLEPCLSKAT